MTPAGASRARVAVIADTPRRLDEGLLDELASADSIVHAGGFADAATLDALRALGPPVTAVVGHEDYVLLAEALGEIEELSVGDVRILVTAMIGTPPRFLTPVRRRLDDEPPDVVLHGHPAFPLVTWHGGTLLLNPGSCGGRNGAGPRTWGVLELGGPGKIEGHIHEL